MSACTQGQDLTPEALHQLTAEGHTQTKSLFQGRPSPWQRDQDLSLLG